MRRDTFPVVKDPLSRTDTCWLTLVSTIARLLGFVARLGTTPGAASVDSSSWTLTWTEDVLLPPDADVLPRASLCVGLKRFTGAHFVSRTVAHIRYTRTVICPHVYASTTFRKHTPKKKTTSSNRPFSSPLVSITEGRVFRLVVTKNTSGLAAHSPGVAEFLTVGVEFVVPALEVVGTKPVIVTTETRHPTFVLTRDSQLHIAVAIPDDLQSKFCFKYH